MVPPWVNRLDEHQREVVRRVLKKARAPFALAPEKRFRESVRKVWADYQSEISNGTPKGLLRLAHKVDRALYVRNREEHMDDPALDPQVRTGLVKGLDRLNRAIGTYFFFFRAMEKHLHPLPDGQLSVLDIGSGHGAFPIRLARKGKLGRHVLRVVGSDVVPAYVEAATAEARKNKSPVEFRTIDALKLDQLEDRFDVITCTQAIHHFPPDFLAELMARARANARKSVFFFDARRAPGSVAGVATATYLLTRNAMLVHDGIVSVRRMYSPAELELLARCAPGGEIFRARNFSTRYVLLEAYAGRG
ncbi:MAG: methyltransferase domain-containing protein [Nitrospirae bacterium]|nr:methyltransferase domain-containing protein [Nitrospirota bacterium]